MFRHALLAVVVLSASTARAGTLVVDDFTDPAPAIAIDSATGDVPLTDVAGPYGRSLVTQSYAPGPVSYRIGNGSFIRRPDTGASGYTALFYGAYTRPGTPMLVDLSGYRFARFDFTAVTGGDAQNLNIEFYNGAPTAARPLYYGVAGTNAPFAAGPHSVYLPLAPAAAAFDFSHVQGLRVLFDYSGSGVDGFTLDRIAFTTGVPEPGAWALLTLGFGVVGLAARRRTGGVVAAA